MKIIIPLSFRKRGYCAHTDSMKPGRVYFGLRIEKQNSMPWWREYRVSVGIGFTSDWAVALTKKYPRSFK